MFHKLFFFYSKHIHCNKSSTKSYLCLLMHFLFYCFIFYSISLFKKYSDHDLLKYFQNLLYMLEMYVCSTIIQNFKNYRKFQSNG